MRKNTTVAVAWVCGDNQRPEVLTLVAESGRYRWRNGDGSDTGVTGTTIQDAWEQADNAWKAWHIRGTHECPYCGY